MAKKDVFAPVDTDHPAFRSWFGKSVLHDEGVPRTYYHGTSKDTDFKKFKMSRHGIWMTTDPKEASSYAAENDSQGFRAEGWNVKPTNTASRVIPVHARIEKPFVGEMPQDFRMKENYKKAQSDWFDSLRSQGYDGWVPKSENGNIAVALGHPGQIKSALSNTGDYSETGDINKAEGGTVDDSIPHNDSRRSKNLSAWHEGSHSATKNDDGSPRVYYHGSNQKLDVIKPGMRDPGAWFTTNLRNANNYARGENAHVHEVYLKSKNPMVVPFDYDENDKLHAFHNGEKLPFSDNVSIVKYAQQKGYDGVHFPYGNFSEEDDTFVVFDPHQIKSVDNEGEFNPHEENINKAEGGSVEDDIPQIENPVSVFPKPQRMFPEDAPVPGGQYLNAKTKEDMTGRKTALASIGVHPGGKPYFNASPDEVDETGTPGKGSARAKTNLFKQKAGWKWVKAPDGHEDTGTIVSVEHRGQHHYALNAHFPKGVDLARYENATSEPRLRPTTVGNLTRGQQVGSILVRGREHPVYDHVIVKAGGGSVDDENEGLTAYHGSPHDFEQFDISKIGTGEGAQAYGHGLYFAEAEPVARGYRDKLAQGTYQTSAGKVLDPYGDLEHLNIRVAANKSIDNAIDRARGLLETQPENADMINRDLAKLMEAKAQGATPRTGHMYEVRIKANPDYLLDWDHDFNHDNNAVVGDLLPGVRHYDRVMSSFYHAPTGGEFYEKLSDIAGSHAAASRLLREVGVRGVQYLDAGSRDSGEGTRNYVVFDHDLVKVKRKYARGGAV